MPESLTTIDGADVAGVAANETAADPSPPPRDAAVEASCANCGEALGGRYCSRCGERKLAGEDYSLRRFLFEAFNVLTNFESNVFRSFDALLLRPGRLTVEYFRGRRKPYLKPLQLFVFCNVIFFFAQSYTGINSLTTRLHVHLNNLPYSGLARRMVDAKLGERNITYDQYRPRFDAAIEGQAKTLVIVMVPLFALVTQALYWRSRRYYVEHLIFSLHFYAFLLLLIAALHLGVSVVWRARHVLPPNLLSVVKSDDFGTFLLLAICGAYLFVALRRTYGQSKIWTAIKCLAFLVCIIGVIQVYRFILFFTTFYFV